MRVRPSRSPAPVVRAETERRRHCFLRGGPANVLKGQDTLLLSDSLVLSRNALSQGAVLVEQLWQRLMPRADAESSPAARRLADDAKRVASKLSLSAVRPMGLTAAGGAERCRIEVGAGVLGDVRGSGDGRAAGCLWWSWRVRIYDPVAGGAALVVIDVELYFCGGAGGLQRPGDGRAAFGLWM